MTQVEVPQISLQRYFDLLKRRRWQVIPVSLLGLLIGGLVAVFIPRYYVAETTLTHEMVAGSTDPDHPEDPFRSIVDSAKLSMPLAIGETIEALNWPEAAVADASLRTQNERGIERRLRVDDRNPGTKNRTWAQISVTYSDRDAQRAASFLNTLVSTWIDKRLKELREPAELELKRATQAVNYLRALHEQWTQEKKQIAVQYEIDPNLSDSLLQHLQTTEQQRVKTELRTKAEETERLLQGKRQQLAAAVELRDRTDARIVPDERLLLERIKGSPKGQKILVRLEWYQERLRTFRPGTHEHAEAARGIEESTKALEDLVGASERDGDGLVANPAFTALQDAITAVEAEVAVLEAQFETLRTQLDDEAERVQRRALGFSEYQRKDDQCTQARQDLDAANTALRQASAVIAALQKQQTIRQVYKAQPPPRPTDPNILVVALLGSVLGLGAAIGLILLLDFVQGTFKTLDDVERALPVPVLGGMSHLETDAEREEAVRRRRRVSMTAAAFVTLVVVVVTIFYVDPTRLPPVVRDLLAMLLGS